MIALVILVIAGAFASGYISRGIIARAGSLPPATRRAISRDRARRTADISEVPAAWRSPLHTVSIRTPLPAQPADPLDERLTSAIVKLGDHYEPAAGWQAQVDALARSMPIADALTAGPPWAPQACIDATTCPQCAAQVGQRCATDRPLHVSRWDAWARAGFPRRKERPRG